MRMHIRLVVIIGSSLALLIQPAMACTMIPDACPEGTVADTIKCKCVPETKNRMPKPKKTCAIVCPNGIVDTVNCKCNVE